MYTVVSALGVKFGLSKTWEAIAVATYSVAELYATYRRAQVTLRLPSSASLVYLDLDAVRTQYAGYAGTLAELLVSIGNQALPTTATPLVLKTRTAKYRDCFQAGYTVTPVNRANNASSSISALDKKDIRLTRTTPLTDYMAFFKHCLVSVNGYYHLCDTDGVNGVVVADAMTSLRHSQQNQLGLYSFHSVCAFDTLRITPEMVQHSGPAQTVVTLPADLTDKTVMLVLGGYLHALDPTTLVRVGQSAYRIDFDNLPLLERYFESRAYLDLSSLPLDTTVNNDAQITRASLRSPECLMAYLLLSQTFFVILDCPEIYTQKQFVKRTGLPDMYIAYQEPQYPLVTELGRQPEYWSVAEDGQYSVTVYDNVVGNRLFNTVTTPALLSTDDANQSTRRGHISAAHFLEIGRDI